MDELLSTVVSLVASSDRWPFWTAVVVFSIVGQFTTLNFFTRERAYGHLHDGFLIRNFWWWGRESLMLHPLVSGAILGALLWVNPEGADPAWSRAKSMAYFTVAGGVSLVFWMFFKGAAKKRGYKIQLPGVSEPPSKPPPADEKSKGDADPE